MNIHEYQAKKLLKKFKIDVKKGVIAYTPLEALKAGTLTMENYAPVGTWEGLPESWHGN